MWLFFLFILQHIDRGIPKRTTVMQIKTVAPSTAAMKMVRGAYLMQLLARFYLVRFSDPLPMGSGSGDQCP